MMTPIMISRVFLLSLLTLLLVSCGKEESTQPATTGTITGTVTFAPTGEKLAGVIVTSVPPTQSVTTGTGGTYTMSGVVPGTYTLIAVKTGSARGTVSIVVTAGQTTVADIVLDTAAANRLPLPPSNPTPTDGSLRQSVSPALSWTSSDPDGDSLTYDVFIGTTSTPTQKIGSGLTSPSLSWSGLQKGTTYYWSVVAKDGKGSVVGPVWTFTTDTGSAGGLSSALEFLSSSLYTGKAVNVPFASDLHKSGGDFTIEAWVRAESFPQWSWIVCKGTANDNLDYLLGFVGSKPQFVTRNGANILNGAANLELGRWYHLAAVQDLAKQRVRLYVDGELSAEAALQGTVSSPITSLFIGARESKGAPVEGFSGVISDVRIWNVARSQEDIVASRIGRLTGSEPSLAAYWPLNEGQGSTANDRSGKGHTGTLINAPAWIQTILPIP